MTRPRPRLLFLGQTLPYPPDGGVNIRMYHTIRILSQAFDVTALCFYRRQERISPAAVTKSVHALARFGQVEAFPIPQEHSRARWVWDHLRSVLTGRAYTLYAYDSETMARRIRELRQEREFDLAHIDSLDLAGYLPHLRGLPTVGTHHNVESSLLARRAERERLPWRRWYLAHQARLTERLERVVAPQLALNVTVSAGDAELLRRHSPDARFFVAPNGADADAFRPAPAGGEEGVLGVGGLNWAPNQDALDLLCDQILPPLRLRLPGVSVRWVGRASEGQRELYGRRYGVVLTGYVDDVRTHLAQCACVVAPLRAGGGTRLKILDAWAMGKAVVSTTVGCEGLDAVDGENILIRDAPEAFALAVTELLADAGLRSRLGAAGRRTVETTYSWEVIGAPMLREYLALAGRGATVAALAS